VEGLSVGEQVTTEIPPEEAYGPRNDALVMEVGRDQFPEDASPAVGQQFQMSTTDGRQAVVTVTSVSDEKVEIDANHPLAGRALSFELELVKIS